MVREVDTGDDASVEYTAEIVVDDEGVDAEPVIVGPIEKPPGITRSGFFDPANPSEEPKIVLRRLVEKGAEVFKLDQPIGYWDEHEGAVIVPENLAHFRTDLTSVPRFFTWLVPRTGLHLPAALVHDGLVHETDEPQTYIAGHEIDRLTSDRILRSGMRDLGTSWVRRWLIWTAVTAATLLSGAVASRWRWWLVVGLTVGGVVVGGTLATIDLFDCRELLPWMGDRPVWLEVVTGGIGAIVIPVALAATWGRQWRAGVIAGIALALLVHVTVAVSLVYGVFTAVESVLDRRWAQARRWTAWTALGGAALIGLGLWAC